MDIVFAPAFLPFAPVQFAAASYGRSRPAQVQVQPPEQFSIVQGLREALHAAINEIKGLKEENTALKEKVGLLESQQVEVDNLKEELQQKDVLLKRAIKKRQARTKAYNDTLHLLTQKELELERKEEQWRKEFAALEASLIPKTDRRQTLPTIWEEEEEQLNTAQEELVEKINAEAEEDEMKQTDENVDQGKVEIEEMENERKEMADNEGKEKMRKKKKEKMEKEKLDKRIRKKEKEDIAKIVKNLQDKEKKRRGKKSCEGSGDGTWWI